MTTDTVSLLRELVKIETVSTSPNLQLIELIAERLRAVGVTPTILADETGTKANLYATIGSDEIGGVLLSGHTDVVPTTGQAWSSDPFALRSAGGRHYGRGTADMKGFVASAVIAIERAARQTLTTPLHLALSYDEEIGCVGVRSLIETLAAAPFQPRFCIVGEPTQLLVATGHKGKVAMRAACRGREAHSALAPSGLNAIYLAAELISELRGLQHELEQRGARDDDYDVPYSTVHVGVINGGTALNIVPNQCDLLFEIRTVAADDSDALVAQVRAAAAAITAPLQKQFAEVSIDIEVTSAYPGLETPTDAEVVRFVRSLTGANDSIKVAFGTEGGLFNAGLGMPVVICGPGSMQQGHKPDEYVSDEQLTRCDAMLDALVNRLVVGL